MSRPFLWLFFILGSAPAAAQTAADQSTMTMALTGDAIITRRLSVYTEPAFVEMIDLIRDADVAFTNLEVLFHDYEPYPMHRSGGTYMRADPALAHELAWAGFDLVSRANNHTGDYGVEGMRLTTRYVAEAGLVDAGVGESLTEAREAKFLETAKGRVALISVASTFPDHSRAGRTRGDIPPRPGLNPLRYTTTRVATAVQIDRLRAALDDVDVPTGGSADTLRALGETFVVGDAPGRRTAPDPVDVAEIGRVVRSAKMLADYVILTIHAHESGSQRAEPAEFLVTFARAMIEAGADVFVGHGPHVLRGIEIYRGKPIFYSLGDFLFQNETLLRLPSENYQRFGLDRDDHVGDFNHARYDGDRRGFPANREIWEAVIAQPTFRDGALTSITLHPITLGYGQPRWERGRPMLARGALAEKILRDLIDRSAPFGTTIHVANGVGVVSLP